MKNIHKVITLVGIFLLLWFVMTLLVSLSQRMIADYSYQGFPLKYTSRGGMCPEGPCPNHVYPSNLVIDIIFWIAVSGVITYLVSRKNSARGRIRTDEPTKGTDSSKVGHQKS